MENLLEISDLRIAFYPRAEKVNVLNGLNLSAKRQKILGIVGESGSGKSVAALSMLNLVQKPGKFENGRILFEGMNLLDLPEKEIRRIRGKDITLIPSNPRTFLHPLLPVSQQIANIYLGHNPGVSVKEANEKVIEVLRDVQIPDPEKRMNTYPNELSGGMAQRVLIAMALINEPKLIIADDATTGLDVTIQRQVLDLIKQMVTTNRRTAILVTHDIGVVAHYCNEVAIMFAGRIVEKAESIVNLFSNPYHPYTSTLLSSTPGTPLPYSNEVMPAKGAKYTIPETGCLVYPRCLRGKGKDVCKFKSPKMVEVNNGHWVECHFPNIK